MQEFYQYNVSENSWLAVDAPSITTRPWYFGESVFETIRIFDKKIQFLDPHLTRLERGVNFLFPIDSQIIFKNVENIFENLAKRNFDQSKIRMTCFWENKNSGHIPGTGKLLLSIENIKLDKISNAPVELKTISTENKSSPSFLKLGSYGLIFRDVRLARIEGFSDVLFTNSEGTILEASTSNFFAYDGKNILTPKLKAGILDGIVRAELIKFFHAQGIETTEIDIEKKLISTFKDAWLTSSIKLITPINKIDNNNYKNDFIEQYLEEFEQYCQKS